MKSRQEWTVAKASELPRWCDALGQSAFGAFLKAFALRLLALVVQWMGFESKAVRKNNCSAWSVGTMVMAACAADRKKHGCFNRLLGEKVRNDFPMHVREAAVNAVVAERQFLMINAELMKDRGVQVVTIRRIRRGFV